MTTTTPPPNATVSNSKVSEETRELLKQLTIEEKVALLSGVDFVHMSAVPRLDIPGLKVEIPT